MVHDDELDLWGVVMNAPLKLEGGAAAERFLAQLIVRGAAMP
jgi:hypothetical protein